MSLERGNVVYALSGRERGFFAVLGQEGNRVLIANGRQYRVEKPKRKNPKHLAITHEFVSESNLAYNNRLKKALSAIGQKPNLTGG